MDSWLKLPDTPEARVTGTETWPSLKISDAMVEAAVKANRYYPRHVAHVALCEAAGVPYGAYLTVGVRLRVAPKHFKQARQTLMRFLVKLDSFEAQLQKGEKRDAKAG